MTKPKIFRLLCIGILGVIIVSTLSFFIKLTPCMIKTTDATTLGLCKLPSIFSDLPTQLTNQYYFISNNPLTGLVFQFLITLIALTILLLFFKKSPKKVLDLTKEKNEETEE